MSDTDQLSLSPAADDVPAHRVRALAGVLAGFRWPGRGSFEQLKVAQKKATTRAAERVLSELQMEPD